MDIAENAERSLRMVREAKDLVYDTETSGVDWRYNAPVGYVIGAANNGIITQNDVVYVPVRHGGGGNISGGKALTKIDDEYAPHEYEKALAKAFEDRNRTGVGPVVGHNIKFDCHFSANAGVLLGRNMICTQNYEAILDEYQKSFSLDSCAKRHGVTAKLGGELYEHMAKLFGGAADRKQMANYWRLAGNDPVAVDYACGDGVTTMQLYFSQREEIEKEELQYIANLESELIWTIFRMERKGMAVDANRIDHLREVTEDRVSKIMKELPSGFNTRSPTMMKRLMEDNGHTDWPKTDKGNPSFTEKWLKSHDIGKKIIEIRQNTNLLNSFVNPLAERHMFKGRVHATLNQLKSDDKGTVSGRFSCSDPNLQQVPKRVKELAKPFRRLFVADEGHTFFEYDWSAAEPRLFAHYSQDPKLLEAFNSVPPVDMHTVTANLLGVERDPTAKRMGMGLLTGMSANSLAGHMGCSQEQAMKYYKAFFNAYPSIKRFSDKARERIKNRGYVYTVLGRRCRMDDPRFAYRATSKIIQGSQADLMKSKLLTIDRMCEENGDIVQILMTIHDAIEGQRQNTPEAEKLLKEVVRTFEDVSSAPYNITAPFVADGFEGADWALATFGPDKKEG